MDNEKEKLRAWVEGWQETGRYLDEMRHAKIKAADTIASIQILDSAYRTAIHRRAANSTSGLVEFHRLMKKSKTDD